MLTSKTNLKLSPYLKKKKTLYRLCFGLAKNSMCYIERSVGHEYLFLALVLKLQNRCPYLLVRFFEKGLKILRLGSLALPK